MASNRFGGDLGVQALEEMESAIEFTEERQVLQYAEAKLGLEIEDFLATNVGRFIVGRARQDIEEFTDWSLSEDADPSEFAKRRAKALAARTLVGWLSEQVAAGLAAEQQLNHPEQG